MHALLLCAVALALTLAPSDAAVRVFSLRANGLKGDPAGNPPDPFVKVWCGSSFGGMTEFHKDNSNPSWSASFYFRDCGANDHLTFEVWDKDLNFDDLLGTCVSSVQPGLHQNFACSLQYGTLFYSYEL
uniref:C2 domain-containing protein n=1 Tax=Electrophorus electricus TaxID=8005 RepID=A0A4W4GI80_ELEEL